MTYLEQIELADSRETASKAASASGGYSEYAVRCACAGVDPTMDEATFLARKALDRDAAAQDGMFPRGIEAMSPFDQWRILLGETPPPGAV